MAEHLEDPRKSRYVDWLVTDPAEREPSSNTALAAELGVSRRTLYDWRQEPEFRRVWDDLAFKVAGDPERTQRVMDAMFQQAVDPESQKQVQAANAWAKMAGIIKPPKKDEGGPEKLTDLSADELDAMLTELLSKAAKQ